MKRKGGPRSIVDIRDNRGNVSVSIRLLYRLLSTCTEDGRSTIHRMLYTKDINVLLFDPIIQLQMSIPIGCSALRLPMDRCTVPSVGSSANDRGLFGFRVLVPSELCTYKTPTTVTIFDIQRGTHDNYLY